MASLGLVFLRASLIPSFLTIEQAAATDDAGRIVEGVEAQLSNLDLMTRDWANWDDMYRFAEKPTSPTGVAFLESNLSTPSLLNASLSLVMVFDRTKQTIGYRSIEPGTGNVRDLGLFLPEKAKFLTLFLNPTNERNCGVMEIDSKMLMVCWRSILPSNKVGTVGGTLVMARDFDKGVLSQIKEQTKLSFEVLNSTSTGNGGTWWSLGSIPKYLPENQIQAVRSNEAIVLDYRLLDVLSKPIATIRVSLPRELMAQGKLVFSRIAFQLGVIAAVTGLLLLAAIQVWFVKPLATLARSVTGIRRQKAWQERVVVSRHDEIGKLSKEINGLLGVINAQIQDLETLSMTDPLTGLANRRAFDMRLLAELQRVKRANTPLSLLLLDIDYFKQYNDHYGHPAGDRAIQALAQAMTSAARRDLDLYARIGGEEFAVLLSDTSLEGAQRVAESVQAEVARRFIPHAQSAIAEWVTVSIGIATATSEDESPAQLLARADQALYAAKKNGRNRFEMAA
ncbi:MAG: diguanylate cyclase [Pseudomonadota bacterium]